MTPSPAELAQRVLAGDRRAVARAISHVEDDAGPSDDLLRIISRNTGTAYRIGVTGPPGAGKSTLTNKLAGHYRGKGKRVGIIAVDPTSPFTGGGAAGRSRPHDGRGTRRGCVHPKHGIARKSGRLEQKGEGGG